MEWYPVNSGSYQLNSPKVISQTIDGEAVVVNLDSGCYYSLNRTASALLDFLSQGLTAGEIAARAFTSAGEGSAKSEASSPGEIEDQVRQFIDRLLDEGILRERPGSDSSASGTPPSSGLSAASPLDPDQLRLEPPVITRYSDMQELLLLDPVHEVTDSGWPTKKPKGQ